jgi:hypothetical protein
LEGGAIFLMTGRFSNFPWSPIGATICSLSASNLLFAADVMANCELEMSKYKWKERKDTRSGNEE